MTAKIKASSDGTKVLIGTAAEDALQIDSTTKLISAVAPYTLAGGGGGGDYLPITGGTLTGNLSIDPPGVPGYTAYYSNGALKGYVYAAADALHLLNEAGSIALTVPVGSVNVNVAGNIHVGQPNEGVITFAATPGYLFANANVMGFYVPGGVSWGFNLSTGNLNAPSFSSSGDINAGNNVSVGGPYLFLNGVGGTEVGALIAFNTPGFGNSNQLYGKHVGGNWVGFQMDTPQLAGYRWDGSGFTSPANVTAYSDARLKTDWKSPVVDFVQRLAGLKAGTYLRTDSQIGLRQAGVVAQEVQELLPEAVTNMGDNAFGEGDHTLGLNYGGFSAVAVVMLAREVVALRAELNQLRDELKRK